MDVDPTFGGFYVAKYDERFKLQVVQGYVQGRRGFKELAHQFGLDHGMVRRWVKAHEQHGLDGLRRKSGHYSAQFKLAALQWMWKEDASANQAIARFDIRGGVSVIKDWKRRYDEGGLDALNPKPRGRPKKMTTPEPLDPVPAQNEETRTVEQLRKENEYLRAEVAYLKKLKALLQAKEQPAQKKRG